jgi:hypothetical protein
MSRAAYQREWARKNPEKQFEYQRKYREANREKRAACTKMWREKNKDRLREARRLWGNTPNGKAAARAWQIKNRAEISQRAAERARARRRQVLDAYGGKCACCGVSDWQFLAVDHKFGGGEKHRKTSRGWGDGLMLAIIKSNYPPEYRVLCHNCNQAKGYYGACPHGNC